MLEVRHRLPWGGINWERAQRRILGVLEML